MRSPKLSSRRSRDWYAYYAGYSADFVDDMLDLLDLEESATVLDPWNGSGTTTARALSKGYTAVGFDMNPALVLVARGRLLGSDVAESLDALAADILEHAREAEDEGTDDPEPLATWFEPETALRLRRIECAIQRVLVDPECYWSLRDPKHLRRVSSLAAFFYVALFEVVRGAVQPHVGTNPTWIKIPDKDTRVSVSAAATATAFQSSVQRLQGLLDDRSFAGRAGAPVIDQSSSRELPLEDGSVSVGISSPPYCTRIDYIVATRPELSVLGYSPGRSLKALRDEMLGTPTVSIEELEPTRDWGNVANAFLRDVAEHPSHASATYYYRHFLQYLDGLYASLSELKRVLAPAGRLALVVQDSYYKERRADLAAIITEMAERLGWTRVERWDFDVARTKAAINPGARKYRSSFEATETALVIG